MKTSSNARYQTGQAMVEFWVVGILFLMIVFGLMEMGYLFRTKHTLNAATFDAARTGSMQHARTGPMENALARGMAPLYTRGSKSAAGILRAVVIAEGVGQVIDGVSAPVVVVNPTREVFDRFRVRQRVQLAGSNRPRTINVIPSDNLMWRGRETQRITANGRSAEINIQDANVLKIRTLWCHKLVVPALDRFIHGLYSVFSSSTQVCNAVRAAGAALGGSGYYVPVAAHAVVRMQSPVVRDDLN